MKCVTMLKEKQIHDRDTVCTVKKSQLGDITVSMFYHKIDWWLMLEFMMTSIYLLQCLFSVMMGPAN